MGATSCSATVAPDVRGEHQAAATDVACVFDGDALIKVAEPSVVSLGEAAALPDSSIVAVSEAVAGAEIDAAASAVLPEATESPLPVCVDNADDKVAEMLCSSSAVTTPGATNELVPATLPSATSMAASMSATNPHEDPVPPILVICRHLQAEKKAARDSAPAVEMKADALGPPEDSGPPESVQAAFLNEMGRGTEGHQYDQAEIVRVAKELDTMADPRAFYTKESDDMDPADILHSKKQTAQKQAGAGLAKSKGTKKSVTKEADGKAGPKRKERLPGCAVKAELAKHMTQEELDDHEERRERWVMSEMRKAKQREDINRRMHAACHQQ